ncbi:hypothetical protein MCUN1_003317 [Malassezia cuniculi]|uniref:Ricin B lectin domain-containing protein n=1 Tax=Malassezia cuniculi TaxID=948313 RepID=A0AAF0ESW2_9BASI|nr:hypothetical protein MCUN1_003317 [Malassezia cuniculi]
MFRKTLFAFALVALCVANAAAQSSSNDALALNAPMATDSATAAPAADSSSVAASAPTSAQSTESSSATESSTSEQTPTSTSDTEAPTSSANAEATPTDASPSGAVAAPVPVSTIPSDNSNATESTTAAAPAATAEPSTTAAPKTRIVLPINCTGGYWQSGTLSLPQGQNVSVNANGTLAVSETSSNYTFNECTSTLLGFSNFSEPNATVFYGHISPADKNLDLCLVASRLGADNAPVTLGNCSMSDDSMQMLQFWELVKNGTDFQARLFGHIKDGRDPYAMNLVNDEVTISPMGDSDAILTLTSNASKPVDEEVGPVNRIVSSIICDGGFTQSGTLSAGDLGLLGTAADSPDIFTGAATGANFTFTECKSVLMNSVSLGNENATTYRGHVQVTNGDQQLCLSPSGLVQNLAPIEGLPCHLPDDSGQLLQFWEFNKASNELSFIGTLSEDDADKYGLKNNNGVLSVTPASANDFAVKFA